MASAQESSAPLFPERTLSGQVLYAAEGRSTSHAAIRTLFEKVLLKMKQHILKNSSYGMWINGAVSL